MEEKGRKRRNLVESFNCAIEGIIYVFKTQRNMRIHFLLGILVLILGFFLHLSKLEFIILGFTVGLVLMVEMYNTALELIVNMFTETYHPLARVIKDIAAGAVLIASLLALTVGYLLFFRLLDPTLAKVAAKVKESPIHVTFLSLMAVMIFVLVGKAYSGSGRPMLGGMPSGHSAIAFSIWTAVVFLTRNPLIIALVFCLAFLVGHSRVKEGIHTLGEVVAGAFLGLLVTLLIFQLFS